MKRAVAYLRVSKDEQQLGPHAQSAAIDRWATQHGIKITDWYLDQGISGAIPPEARLQLRAALYKLEAEHIDFLAVATRDRLSRDALQAALLDRQVRKMGARIVAADRGLDDTDEEQLLAGILDNVAEYERRRIAARIKSALAVKKRRSERIGGIPLGWKTVGKILVAWPEERALIDYVNQLFYNGMAISQIYRECQRLEVKSLRTGRVLTFHQIRRLLQAKINERTT